MIQPFFQSGLPVPQVGGYAALQGTTSTLVARLIASLRAKYSEVCRSEAAVRTRWARIIFCIEGTAIIASTPTMVTVVRSSISVKPA